MSWTGLGFARVKDGAGLVFTIENIPYAMEYDIIIRYEPEVGDFFHLFIMIHGNKVCIWCVCVCACV